MNFAITGHQGLIGSFLKKRLEDGGHKCIFKMDLRDGGDVCFDMPHSGNTADIMFHLSANCKINKCISNPEWGFENVLGISQVLEFCRRNNIKKIVSFSSSRVLSKERNPYTAAKIYMEELCKAYAACYNIEYIIIRPSTVYGPFYDKTHRLIDMWIRSALNDNDIEIYGDPKTKTLDFTYIDDFIDSIMLALKEDKWNTIYDISGEEECNLKDLADFIIKEIGSNSNIVIGDAETQQPQRVSVNISEIKNIGYIPKVSLKEGVKKTIDFYKKNNLT